MNDIAYKERLGFDGTIHAKVPLHDIRFRATDDEMDQRITGPDLKRYGQYAEAVKRGVYANGIPIVYRGPKGTLIASDLRHSDLALYAELKVKRHLRMPVMIGVKIIKIDSLADIAAKRAAYVQQLEDDGKPIADDIIVESRPLPAKVKAPEGRWSKEDGDILIRLESNGSLSLSRLVNAVWLAKSFVHARVEALVALGIVERVHDGANRESVYRITGQTEPVNRSTVTFVHKMLRDDEFERTATHDDF